MVLSIALIAACSDNNTNTAENEILFEPCEDSPALDCGSFEVPLIHDTTDTRRLNIAVARLPGTGEGPHEPLLLNLGGPGSGIEALRDVSDTALLSRLRERYDIIGFDQRGVGSNLLVDCDHLGEADSLLYPANQNDLQTLVNDRTLLADACMAEYSDQLH